ncbi:MAG: DUF4412 domain-containing protein [bacterium]
MLRLLFLIPLLTASMVFAATPTDYSTDMVILDGREIVQTLKLYVSGEKSRLEGMTAGPLGPIVTISRKDRGVVWTLFVNKKQYSEQSLAANPALGKADLSSFDLVGAEKEILGKEKVMGHPCTKMRVKAGALPNGQPMTSMVWVADDVGLPIRLEAMGIVQENRNVRTGPQPSALFEIPPGFERTDAPGMRVGTAPPSTPTTKAKKAKPVSQKAKALTGHLPPEPSIDSLEADALEILRCTSGEVAAARLADDGYAMPGAFTDDQTLYWRNAGPIGAALELRLPVRKTGRYRLTLHLGQYRTFGKFQLFVNRTPVGRPVDFFGFPEKDEVVPFTVDLGEVVLHEGDNQLMLKLAGTNPATVMPDHGACIDWVELTFRGGEENGDSGGANGSTGQDPSDDAPAAAVPTVPTAPTGPTVPTVTGGSDEPTGRAVFMEADTLEVIRCTSGEVMPRKLAADGYADEGVFTGDLSLQWHDAGEPGAVLELALPVEKEGRYTVSVQVARYRTYAIHQFLINGKPLGKPVDMFGNPGHDIVTAFTVDLGRADLKAGVNILGVRLTGTNPDTIMANHGAGLDWISLTPAGRAGK